MLTTAVPVSLFADRVDRQRLAATLLVLTEILLIAFPSRDWGVGLAGMAIVLANLLFASRDWLIRAPLFWQVVAVTIFFTGKYLFYPHVFPMDSSFINSEMSHEIACGLIGVQVCMLFNGRYRERFPSSLVILGGIAVVFGCNVRVHLRTRDIQLGLVLLNLVAISMFAMTSRRLTPGRGSRWRTAVLAGVIAAFGVFSASGAVLLARYEKSLEQLVLTYIAGTEKDGSNAAGFSGQGTLSHISEWKTTDQNRIRLTVSSRGAPGYLRGRVWQTYLPQSERWGLSSVRERVGAGGPINAAAPAFAGSFFRVGGQPSPDWTTLLIRPDDNSHGGTFLPLETSYVYIDEPQLAVDVHNMVIRRRVDAKPYSAFVPTHAAPEMMTNEVREACLRLPSDLDERVINVASSLFGSLRTPREKIQAVETFFHRNFKYRLGITPPRGQDPLAYFLTKRPPAHCEYFATAAAVLLRVGGVPTRYVTGYVAAERNELGEVWFARSRDAHAWVEAYDEEAQRWRIVEATPGEGVPSDRTSAPADEVVGGIWQTLLNLKEILENEGLAPLVWHLIQSPAVQVTLLGGMILLFLQYRRRGGQTVEVRVRTTTRYREWHRVLQEMDAGMARLGLRRGPDETPLQFADRVREMVAGGEADEAAKWYHDYATARYSPDAASPPANVLTLPKIDKQRFTKQIVSREPPPTS
jgi:transglutaminase-like putative cysteine protease